MAASTPLSCAITASAADRYSEVSVPRNSAPQGRTVTSFVAEIGLDAVGSEEIESGIEASTRERDVFY